MDLMQGRRDRCKTAEAISDTDIGSTAYSVRFVLLLIAVLCVFAIAAKFTLVKAGQHIDKAEARNAEQAVIAAVSNTVNDHRIVAVDYGMWNEAYAQLSTGINEEWAENNLGPWLYKEYGIEITAIIDTNDRTIYFTENGESVSRGVRSAFPPALNVLIEQAHAIPATEPEAVAAFLRRGDGIHLVSVSPISPESPNTRARQPTPRPLIILSDRIDGTWVDGIGTVTANEGVGLSVTPSRERGSLPLLDPSGIGVGFLSWSLPGRSAALISTVAPWLVTAFLATVVLTGIIALQFLRTARALARRNAALLMSEANAREAQYSAEEANRAKSTFLASVSHEVRTPLNAIIGFSDVLRTEATGPLKPATVQEYAGYVHDSGQRLLTLLNDILDLAKVEAGHMELHFDVVDPLVLFRECLRTIEPVAKRRSIDLSTEISGPLPNLKVDPGRLEQVILNLLGNAAKYTERGGQITLRASLSCKGVEIAVADTGIGISEADLDRVFEPFTQVGNPMFHRHDGVGLGLALARQFCSALGGSLKLTSVLGVGTTAQITLPPDCIVTA